MGKAPLKIFVIAIFFQLFSTSLRSDKILLGLGGHFVLESRNDRGGRRGDFSRSASGLLQAFPVVEGGQSVLLFSDLPLLPALGFPFLQNGLNKTRYK